MAQATAKQFQKSEDIRQYLTFRLGNELFSIGIEAVKEIIEYNEVTDVPAMPVQFRGVINLRGQAVPVVDMLAWFGRGSSTVTRRTCIVIIELGESANHAHRYAGVMVDSVNEVLEINSDDIQPPPTFGTTIRADFIKGMGRVYGKFIIILDIAKLLLSNDVMNLNSVMNGGSNTNPVPAPNSGGNCPTLDAVMKNMRHD